MTKSAKAPKNATKSSVVASLLSGGYQVGNAVIQKAKYYDQKRIKSTLLSAKEKILEINDKYEISKKAEQKKDELVSGMKYLGSKISTSIMGTPKSTADPKASEGK